MTGGIDGGLVDCLSEHNRLGEEDSDGPFHGQLQVLAKGAFILICDSASVASLFLQILTPGFEYDGGCRLFGGKWNRQWYCRCRWCQGSKISIVSQGNRPLVHRRAGQATDLSQGLADTTRIYRYLENAQSTLSFGGKLILTYALSLGLSISLIFPPPLAIPIPISPHTSTELPHKAKKEPTNFQKTRKPSSLPGPSEYSDAALWEICKIENNPKHYKYNFLRPNVFDRGAKTKAQSWDRWQSPLWRLWRLLDLRLCQRQFGLCRGRTWSLRTGSWLEEFQFFSRAIKFNGNLKRRELGNEIRPTHACNHSNIHKLLCQQPQQR